jgi:hypothetical protein
MARTKRCSRQCGPQVALPNCVALGPEGQALTLQPVPPKQTADRQGRLGGKAGTGGRGVSIQVSSSDAAGAAAAVPAPKAAPAAGAGTENRGDASALSPTMAVVAAVRAWQASPPTGGQLIRPPEGSPRSDRPTDGAEPLLAAEHPCTMCGEVKPRHALQRHPTLAVASCESCVRYFLSDGRPDQWARYSNGKERYCSWCAHNNQCHEEGSGVVVECSSEGCPKVFCAACITRNFGGKHYHEATKNPAWQCYACDPEILRTLASYEVVVAEEPKTAASASAARNRSTPRSVLAQFLEKWLAEHPECLVDGRVQAPDKAVKEKLAAECQVSVARVSDWFWDQNRRRKKNKRSAGADLQIEPGTETTALGRCSACGTGTTLVAHDLLSAKVCRSCFSTLHGLATCAAKDRPTGAALACRWCGRSGTPTVTCADVSCPSGGHGYCEHCITRNFSFAAWKAATRSYTLGQWSCYACQPERLRTIPELGCRISVAFEGEGTSIGRVVGIDGTGVAPGQLRVQFDPPGSEPWLIDPAAGHLFEVLSSSAAPTVSFATKAAAMHPTGNGDTTNSALSGASPPPSWTPEMRQRFVALVERDGTGDWQRKTELLGYGHTGKQLSNKWRSMMQTAANAAPRGGLPGSSVASIPKVRKPVKKSAPVPSVTIIHKGESYDVTLPEATSADARGARLESKIRAELQLLPGQRFVLVGTKGKLTLATVATQPGCTFAAHIVDKRRRGTAQAARVLCEEAVGTTPKRTSVKRQGPSAEGQPAPKKAARKSRPKPAAKPAATPGSKANAWVRSLALGDEVVACDYRGEWHEGRVVDLQRFQVRATRRQPVLPSSHVCVGCFFWRTRRDLDVALAFLARSAGQGTLHRLELEAR